MPEPLLERVRRGAASPSLALLADVFAFVAGHAGQDCDCDCVDHDEDGHHVADCAICEWCEAEYLVERWEVEHPASVGVVDHSFTSLPPLVLPDPESKVEDLMEALAKSVDAAKAARIARSSDG